MSWELASFLILGAVLLGGFAWYERSRPPAQVVALVAALAALAIAGRIAFAAFPNVKPTTDIVVFAGYALGGAPGFAVGALAALVSNFWFGQGPWTPWQMAAIPIQSQGRELVDNMADMAHFGPIHYSTVKSFKNSMAVHNFVQYIVVGHQILTEGAGSLLTSVATYEGPAYMTTTMTGSMEGKPMGRMTIAHASVRSGMSVRSMSQARRIACSMESATLTTA